MTEKQMLNLGFVKSWGTYAYYHPELDIDFKINPKESPAMFFIRFCDMIKGIGFKEGEVSFKEKFKELLDIKYIHQ